ncbi:AMP-binding protein, partial [Neogemmobacter tilapiae]|uniref:AMP-binding protein n=1 Tax=Neogemmobacter tilapiae TaxID=875041 RepID=UPI001E65D4BF
MQKFAVIGDKRATEAEMPWAERGQPKAIYPFLARARDRFAARSAVSFQLTSGPADKATTLTWGQLHDQVVRAANLFRSLGIGPGDAVAYVLPNSLETV